jgi:hypothetical protein
MPIVPSEDWLGRLVAAEDAGLRTGGDRRSFMLMHRGGMQREVDHPGWDPSWPSPTEHDIDDLLEQGWVRLDAPNHSKTRIFSLTTDGRLRASAPSAPAPASSASPCRWSGRCSSPRSTP